jgi:hypothetical protein
MKNFLLLISIFCCTSSFCQTQDTTVVEIKSSWYGRTMPISLYAGAGLINDKISQNIEIGRSFGVVDAGLVYGRNSLRADSNQFLEARVTMDAAQYGIFSNEFSVGAGMVFNTKTPIMLELSYSLLAQVSTHWGIGIVTGYYDFSGNYDDNNKTYYGLFLRYGLLRTDNGGLLSRVHIHHRKKKLF